MVARSGKGWKLAAALITLEDQVNAKYPGRAKGSDGSIGDLAHAARASDHNVRNGFCHALDLTHDPKYGFDSYKFADHLLATQDPRISYIISNGRIGSGPDGPSPGKWRKYTGKNAHTAHVHISTNVLGELDGKPWNIGDKSVKPQPDAPPVKPVLRKSMKGNDITNLKALLKVKGLDVSQVTNIFDNETRFAVMVFQLRNGLVDDGVVGPDTWKKLTS